MKFWYCNKSGHLKKDYWKRQASKEDSSEEDSRKEANATQISSGIVDEVLSVFDVFEYHHEWLLNYGASHHMCLHKNWVSIYQSINNGMDFHGK